MMRMLPLATFLLVAILCQTGSVLAAISVDGIGGRWTGLAVFGVLYLGMFAVAWKITVLIVDRFFVPRGYVEGGETKARGGRHSRDLAPAMR